MIDVCTTSHFPPSEHHFMINIHIAAIKIWAKTNPVTRIKSLVLSFQNIEKWFWTPSLFKTNIFWGRRSAEGLPRHIFQVFFIIPLRRLWETKPCGSPFSQRLRSGSQRYGVLCWTLQRCSHSGTAEAAMFDDASISINVDCSGATKIIFYPFPTNTSKRSCVG